MTRDVQKSSFLSRSFLTPPQMTCQVASCHVCNIVVLALPPSQVSGADGDNDGGKGKGEGKGKGWGKGKSNRGRLPPPKNQGLPDDDDKRAGHVGVDDDGFEQQAKDGKRPKTAAEKLRLLKRRQNRKRNKNGEGCFICGDPDHKSYDCPKNNNRKIKPPPPRTTPLKAPATPPSATGKESDKVERQNPVKDTSNANLGEGTSEGRVFKGSTTARKGHDNNNNNDKSDKSNNLAKGSSKRKRETTGNTRTTRRQEPPATPLTKERGREKGKVCNNGGMPRSPPTPGTWSFD